MVIFWNWKINQRITSLAVSLDKSAWRGIAQWCMCGVVTFECHWVYGRNRRVPLCCHTYVLFLASRWLFLIRNPICRKWQGKWVRACSPLLIERKKREFHELTAIFELSEVKLTQQKWPKLVQLELYSSPRFIVCLFLAGEIDKRYEFTQHECLFVSAAGAYGSAVVWVIVNVLDK